MADDLAPLRERLEYALGIDDPDFRDNALRNLRAELPEMLKTINDNPMAAEVMEETMAAALLNGWAQAAEQRNGRAVA